MNPNDNLHDPVDQLIRDALSTEMPPANERRMRAHLAELHERIEAGRPEPVLGRILRMPRWARLVPLAAAALILAAVGGYFLWTPHVVFAEVIRQVREAHTLTFTMTMDITMPPSGQHMTMESKCMVMEPGRSRYEMPGAVMLMDGPKGKGLVLSDQMHTAMVMTITGKAPAANPGASFLDSLQSMQDRAAETLPGRDMDGHRVVGFRVKDGFLPGAPCTLWADVRTGLPVSVEMPFDAMGVRSNATLHDFVLNPPLDESLFDMTPPKGYTLVEVPMDAGPSVEADVAAALAAYAHLTGGGFPSELSPSTSLQKTSAEVAAALAGKLAGAGLTSQQQADIMGSGADMGAKLARAVRYLAGLPADSDWHYAGSAARLGEKDKPICWWRPAGSTTYRVIYADLTVADVAASALPPH